MTEDTSAPIRRRRREASRGRTIASSVVGGAVLIALAVGGIWVVKNPQPVIDQVTVWQYEPGAVVEGHVERLQFTDHGRFLYYASRPVVSSAEPFAKQCPRNEDEEKFGILGCYVHADKVIYLFDVTDERLDGAEEVVAAHEMLHAAWDRMGEGEKQELEALLEVEYARLSDDARFGERMAYYARTEPGQRANELHSIIGTEVPGISAELEEYYDKYFEDRAVVTGLYESSHAVFVQLQAEADAIVASMEELRVSTEADYAAYTEGYRVLNEDIRRFNSNADSGFYATEFAFNRARQALIDRGAELDELYASIQQRSAEYTTMTEQLTQINATSTELQRGLNIGGEVGTTVEP
jgi:hypothetical protein